MGARMVLVKNFPSRMYAEQAKETLEAEGIPSLIQSQFTGMVGLDITGTLPTVNITFKAAQHSGKRATKPDSLSF